MFQIMVVEDDPHTRRLMQAVLRHSGYAPVLAENGNHALEILEKQHVDLMIADVMMPGMDGCELTRQLRDAGSTLPVLMVTARQLPVDKRLGFQAGTDDYMTKPVDEEEMLLRIRALLRRSGIANSHRMQVGQTVLDYDTLTVSWGDVLIQMPPKEFYLVYKLLAYPGKIFTRIQLMDEIWGLDTESDDNTVNVHINRLRNRFAGNEDFEIMTVRGLGYKAVIR